jgi:hypothetical protein
MIKHLICYIWGCVEPAVWEWGSAECKRCGCVINKNDTLPFADRKPRTSGNITVDENHMIRWTGKRK